jgi:hypothetical protein
VRNAKYPTGTVIAGIPWRPEYTEVEVSLTNDSNRDYEAVDVSLQLLGAFVAHVGQADHTPGVTFFSQHSPDLRANGNDPISGEPTAQAGFERLGGNSPQRVRIPVLPRRGGTVRVVFAAVDLSPMLKILREQSKKSSPTIKQQRKTTMKVPVIKAATPAPTTPYGPRPTPRRVVVDGEYVADRKDRAVKTTLALEKM